MTIQTYPSADTGRWRRRGTTIVLDDPFAGPDDEQETGGPGGPGDPGGPPKPGQHQIDLLKRFFGSGIPGARARFAHFTIPKGLTRATLLWYAGRARRVLADPRMATPHAQTVQLLRLQLISRALRQV